MTPGGGSTDPGEQTLEERLAALEVRLGDLENALVENRVLARSDAAVDAAIKALAADWPSAPPAPAARWPVGEPAKPQPTATNELAGIALPRDARGAGQSALPVPAAAGVGRSPTLADLDLGRRIADLEERLTGRALAWVGGFALVLGAIFFLSLAFSRNWIGPEGRVLIGLGAGAFALGAGAVLLERGNRLLGEVVAPIGLAVISISLVGATRLYNVIPVELGLFIALVSAGLAAAIAVRANSQVVAGFGLVSVLAAPPLLGAEPTLTTVAFVAIALAGTTAVALWRTWPWLPPLAFLLTAPQAASWIVSGPTASTALFAIAIFWALNVIAAGGEEFRRRRHELSPSSASLLVVNAAFLVWAGFVVLDGSLTPYRGAFLLCVALAHLAVGGYFIARDGDENLFGLLVLGTGTAALTMAVPVQLGASWVPVAWSAEAVALAWVAVRRAHIQAAIGSALLYALAAYGVVALFPYDQAAVGGIPFINGPGGSLAFFLAAVALGVWVVRDRSAQSALGALGLLLAAWCAIVELAGPSITIALAILVVAGAAVRWTLPKLTERPVAWRVSGLIPRDLQKMLAEEPIRRRLDRALPAAIILVGTAATAHLVAADYGFGWVGSPRGVPFADPAGVALVCYLVSLALVIALDRDRRRGEMLVALGSLVVAWACVFELSGLGLVVGWTLLALGDLAVWSLLPQPDDAAVAREVKANPRTSLNLRREWRRWSLPAAAGVTGGLALLHVLVVELPLGSFGQVTPPAIPFSDTGAASAAILVLATLLAGYIIGGPAARRCSILGAGALAAYTVPFEVYAWAVVVLWAAIAIGALSAARLDLHGEQEYLLAGVGMLGGAAAVALLIVVPPSRLIVSGSPVTPIVAFQSTASLAALAIVAGSLAWLNRTRPWARWAEMATLAVVVYLVSVAVVDTFAIRVGGRIATEELQKQAQVALSVTWAISGIVAFVAGLRLRRTEIRQAGLVLLAVATAKVFLFDFSDLDVAYRVISLIALGLILLLSAGLWQRFQPPRLAATDPGAMDHASPTSEADSK